MAISPAGHGGAVDLEIFGRASLRNDQELRGRAVMTEPTSTTYVRPGWTVGVDAVGNLVARVA